MSVRVYLPVTAAGLRSWLAGDLAGPEPLSGHAVTRELALDYDRPDAADDDEPLRLEALTDAALASAALERAPGDDERVAVLEVESDDVTLRPGEGSSIRVTVAVPRANWVAGYLGPWWPASAPEGLSGAEGRSEVTSLSGDDLGWHGVQELDDALLPPGVTAAGASLTD